MIARHRHDAGGGDVEGDGGNMRGGIGEAGGDGGFGVRREYVVERSYAVRHGRAEGADMADRKHLDGHLHGDLRPAPSRRCASR